MTETTLKQIENFLNAWADLMWSTPLVVSADGRSLLVYTDRRRVRVPLHETYFAEPLAKHIHEDFTGDIQLELFGVLLGGRTRLRVRVQTVTDASLEMVSE